MVFFIIGEPKKGKENVGTMAKSLLQVVCISSLIENFVDAFAFQSGSSSNSKVVIVDGQYVHGCYVTDRGGWEQSKFK